MFNVANKLEDSARRNPEHSAVCAPHGVVSYGELLDDVTEVQQLLLAQGLQPGMCVGLHVPSGYGYIVLTYAIWRCQACSVPIAVELTTPEKRQICSEIKLDFILTTQRQCQFVENVDDGLALERFGLRLRLVKNDSLAKHPQEFEEVNAAFLRFTSGTTGESKGVVLSHEAIFDRIEAANSALQIGPQDRVLWLLSMSYHFTVSIVSYLTYGATIVLCKNHFGKTILETASVNDITIAYGSPSHYDMLTQAEGDEQLGCLRIALSTASALSDEIAIGFQQRFGLPLNQAYGIIEVGLPCINTSQSPNHVGSVGLPTPHFEVELEEVGLGERSKAIKVRGPGMLDAYYVPWKPREEIADGGWFRTGDLGWFDEDGYLMLTGRSKEVISIGGMKFFPQEVEQVLESHPEVSEACVVRKSDTRLGDVAIAHVVLEDQATVEVADLRSFSRMRLANYKVPSEFHFVDSLARTASGKLMRTEVLSIKE